MSTPPSVTSARANTASKTNNPSRRNRRNGCDVVIRPASSDEAAAKAIPESVAAADTPTAAATTAIAGHIHRHENPA